MKLTNQELQEEFFKEIGHKYPDLSFEEIRGICSAPFEMVKKGMESGEMPTMRLQYFGTFTVGEQRAENLLKRMDILLKDNPERKTLFQTKRSLIEKYLRHEK